LQSNDSLAKVASDCDKVLNLKKGKCLALARYLIAKRKWFVNMNQPVRPEEKIIFLSPPSDEF
ncbi:MAG TPA: TnsA endonuclease C-terminal domain-containing protein, partial [Allocoleopsis sp.]